MTKLRVEIRNQDWIEVEWQAGSARVNFSKLRASGCLVLLKKISELKKKGELDVANLSLPQGEDHTDLLIKELFLKLKGQWNPPYQDDELCHCRKIETWKVDQAIVRGFHNTNDIARETSAGSACGTCRPDTKKLIDYRLKK